MAHWWYKVFYKGMPTTEKFFIKNRLPSWLAWFVIIIEPIFAICIITDSYIPFVCIAGIPILLTSAWIYRKNGFFFANGGMEFPLLWAVVQIIFALLKG